MKNVKYIIIIVFVVTVIIVAINSTEKPLYGNDMLTITDTASRLDYLEGKNVEILDWIDLGDVRFVSLLSNGYPTVMEFHLNDRNDYVWKYAQTHQANLFNYIANTDCSSQAKL